MFSRGLGDTHKKREMDQRRQRVLQFTINIRAWKKAGSTLGFWGVTFKANYWLDQMIKSDL